MQITYEEADQNLRDASGRLLDLIARQILRDGGAKNYSEALARAVAANPSVGADYLPRKRPLPRRG